MRLTSASLVPHGCSAAAESSSRPRRWGQQHRQPGTQNARVLLLRCNYGENSFTRPENGIKFLFLRASRITVAGARLCGLGFRVFETLIANLGGVTWLLFGDSGVRLRRGRLLCDNRSRGVWLGAFEERFDTSSSAKFAKFLQLHRDVG